MQYWWYSLIVSWSHEPIFGRPKLFSRVELSIQMNALKMLHTLTGHDGDHLSQPPPSLRPT